MPDKPCSHCRDHEHIIYRVYGEEDHLLYIGKTVHLDRRMHAHRRTTPWWSQLTDVVIERSFSNCEELAAAEVAAIKLERPQYNAAHTGKKKSRKPQQQVREPEWWVVGEAVARSNGAWLRARLEAA